MTDELAVLDALPDGADHEVAERMLREAGWSRCGVGDWAVVLASPSGALAARISPFDPTAPYTRDLFRLAAPTGQVPALHAYVDLEGGAVCTVMERLYAVEPEAGAAFFRSLDEREPHVAGLHDAIERVLEKAQSELPGAARSTPTRRT